MKPKLTPYARKLIARHDAKIQRLVDKSQAIARSSCSPREHVNPFIGHVTAHVSGDCFNNCQSQYHG